MRSLSKTPTVATHSAPFPVAGAVWAALFCLPFMALSFLAYELFSVPFVPFALFEWLSRHLPGQIISVGIRTMVAAISSLHLGETSVVAKLMEEALGVIIFIVSFSVIGGVAFALWNKLRRTPSARDAWWIGLFLAIPVAVFSAVSEHGLYSMVGAFVVALLLCLCWSAAMVYVYRGLLMGREAVQPDHEQIDRRQFIVRVGEATAIVTVLGAGAALALEQRSRRSAIVNARLPWSASHSLPNAGATVQPAPGTRPEFTPVASHYRIDINTIPPFIKESDWRLHVSGLVDAPLDMTLTQLREGFQPMHQFVTLACISNPVGGSLIGTQRWTGVSLQELIKHWKVKDSTTHLKLHAADGFYETVAIDQIKSDPRIMLVYAWDGLPLTAEHGFPLRIYIPDLYGMKQPKWIVSIQALDHDEPGYWVERGWDKVARMKATSVIDTIAGDHRLQHDGQTLIPVGGIAHAGDRGISAVEVQVDGGAWQQAQLRSPLSQTTWVVWRYDWPFVPGHHVFRVRCVDGQGSKQIESVAPPDPNGASGIFSKSADV